MKTVSTAIAAAIIATAFVPATASAAGFFRTAPVEKAATTEATKAGYYGGYYYNYYPRYRYHYYNNYYSGYGYNGYGY
jgi:hypothetical protein